MIARAQPSLTSLARKSCVFCPCAIPANARYCRSMNTPEQTSTCTRNRAWRRVNLDFARVAIRPPVAIRLAAVVSLEPLLVLALEVVFENHTANVCPLSAEALLSAQVGAIERGIVRQLARPAVLVAIARVVVPSRVGWMSDSRLRAGTIGISMIPSGNGRPSHHGERTGS